MSSTKDKITGLANETKGEIKQGIGKMIGNPKLEAEGALQKNVGAAQHAVGKAKDAIKAVVDKA
jgi:uncharacterized protein YjbJ (UPF0337 family)